MKFRENKLILGNYVYLCCEMLCDNISSLFVVGGVFFELG